MKCEKCHKNYKMYVDFRGGDIATRFCKDCSENKNGDFDRSTPEKLDKYIKEICPHYND